MGKHEIKCPNCGTVFEVDEMSYASIVKQIRDAEFNQDLEERIHSFETEKNSAVALAKAETERSLKDDLADKDLKIAQLTNDLRNAREKLDEREKSYENEKRQAIELAETKLKNSLNEEIAGSRNEVEKLRAQLANEEKNQLTLQDGFKAQLQMKQDEIEQLRDMKMKLSTKMIGESLEQHCQNEFDKVRAMSFPNAYFEKDNEISKSGSKGDFIFRDTYDGVESLSIMFEMKNENETTASKHKNVDFLAELDKDRREKNCEYAVLVSLLEQDSDLYNQGIVDVSHRYSKMYVIRPQFFIPMISLLKNAAEKSLETKKELAIVRNQNIDITTFESDIEDWKTNWLQVMQHAGQKHQDAIAQIDKAIKSLEATKKALEISDKHLLSAEHKMDDLTIKKLTKNNPTMRAKFEELKSE